VEEKKSFDLPKPVKEGDILEVTIESVGGKGDGMAKKDGFVIFVPNAQKGEVLKVRITSLKRTFGIGERVEE
jgi:predicted RNA-binding protein with TRAM domain